MARPLRDVRLSTTESTVHPPLSSAILPLRPGTPMDQWKRAIEAGNHAFTARDLTSALGHYRLALRLGQTLVGQWPDPDAALAALVVAHHNLADLHWQAGNIEDAIANVCDAHEALQGLISDTSVDLDLRQAALRHTRQTTHELTRCARTHGGHPLVQAALAHGHQVLTLIAAREFPSH